MKDMKSEIQKRYLCALRDKEFLELYHPTLDALMRQGLPESKARRAAVEFTIANGRPHYHVDHERAYRCVCHLLNAGQKKAPNARTFRTVPEMGLAKGRLAIDHVLEHCRASRFFISPTTALTKICPASRTRALR